MAEERALTVTEAMNGAKRALEAVRVRVVGEVSEFNDKPGLMHIARGESRTLKYCIRVG